MAKFLKQPTGGSSLHIGFRSINHNSDTERSRSVQVKTRRFLFSFGLLFMLFGLTQQTQAQTIYINVGDPIPAVIYAGETYIFKPGIHEKCSGNINIKAGGKLKLQKNVTLRMTDTIHVENCNVADLHVAPPVDSSDDGGTLPDLTKPVLQCYGGELHILDNSKITSCNLYNSGRWGGVYVWGAMQNPGFAECIENRGKVLMNKGTIEKAWVGINTARTAAHLGSVPTYPGGIVKAYESDLINCDRMVNMYGFPYIYLPIPPGGFGSLPINGEEHFVKCNFKYTGTYVPYSGNNTVAKTYSQLAIVFNMQNAQGVNILGSKFQNAYYPISNVDTLPRAINALFSQFTVSNTYANNGIAGGGAMYATATSEIKDFFSGITSLYSGFKPVKVQNTKFQNNSQGITVANAQYTILTGNTINIANINCGGFPPMPDPFVQHRGYGIVLARSTGYTVENNILKGLNGICDFGIGVTRSGANLNHIKSNSIEKTKVALYGNLNNANTSDIETGLRFICNTMTNIPSGIDIYGFDAYNMAAQQSNGNHAAGNTFANPKTSGTGYHIKIENGNYGIDYWFENGPNKVPSELFGASITPKSTENCTASGGGWTSEPDGEMEDLTGWGNSLVPLMAIPPGERTTEQEEEITELLYQYHMLADSMIRYYLYGDTAVMHQDSIVPQLDSVAQLLAQLNVNYIYKVLLAEALHTMGYTDSAIGIIDAIPGSFTLSTEEAERIDNIKTMYQIIAALAAVSNDIDSLHVDDYTALIHIRDNDDFWAAGMARALWFAVHPEDIDSMRIVWYLPYSEEASERFGNNGERYTHDIVVYPSPAREMISFDYPTNETATYTISDIQGRALLRGKVNVGNNDISVSQLSAGIYILTINEGSRVTHRSKIAKQ